MHTQHTQVFAARVRVDGVGKVAELELAEKEKMKAKVAKIIKHDINVFINRFLFSFAFRYSYYLKPPTISLTKFFLECF